MHQAVQAHRELVGRQIRKARKAAGLSHDALAATVGTSRQHLIKLEKGQHLARPEMLAKIADATSRDESFFEDDADEESDPVAALMDALRRVVREELAVKV